MHMFLLKSKKLNFLHCYLLNKQCSRNFDSIFIVIFTHALFSKTRLPSDYSSRILDLSVTVENHPWWAQLLLLRQLAEDNNLKSQATFVYFYLPCHFQYGRFMGEIQCYYFKIDHQDDKPKSFVAWENILLPTKGQYREIFPANICSRNPLFSFTLLTGQFW